LQPISSLNLTNLVVEVLVLFSRLFCYLSINSCMRGVYLFSLSFNGTPLVSYISKFLLFRFIQ
jgi:hypothetical protein